MDMQQVLIENMNLMIKKVTYEKPNGWQFKNRNYKKVIDILKSSDIPSLIKLNNTKKVTEFYTKLFKENGYKNPTKIMGKVIELYEKYFNNKNIDETEMILDEAKEFQSLPAFKAVDIFSKIYGVGPAKIKKLINNGIYNLEQLRDALIKDTKLLNNKQKLGLKHYDDLNERISRSEITKFRKKVETIITTKFNNEISMVITGSYRRGLKTSGDIDMLICSEKYKDYALSMLLKELKQNGMIKETLAKGMKKFMGLIKVEKEGKIRHLDIIETTPTDYPFAMLYFTGSAVFNVQMRKHLLTMGYSLNEYDMTIKGSKTRVPPEKIKEKIGKNNFETEEDIFNFIGIPYREPEKRIKL